MHARTSEDPAPEENPMVVLVHGLVVSSRYMVPAAELLAADYRVYAPDLPGFGSGCGPLHSDADEA
jgi:2-hydroxy-6-oxonona-2,4-dienedioate hydrolase